MSNRTVGIIAIVLLAFMTGMLAGTIIGCNVEPEGTHNSNAYTAIVRCTSMAEDSAAHVRLVEYSHNGETLIYRCERNGY